MDKLTRFYVDTELKESVVDFERRTKNLTRLNRAFAMMLVEQGLLDKDDYAVIDKGLVAIQSKVTKEDILKADPGMDHYFVFEKALYDEIGMDTGCKLHVGRSRNDMYFTLYRMSLRDALIAVAEEILETQRLLEKQASENLETIIPFYTYGQPAQPGTWAHYLMTIHAYFEKDLDRLQHAYRTINRSPMGAAAGIGSAFDLNRERMAELLGFDEVVENTTAANAEVDHYLELISDLAIINTTLGRVGSDLDFFASSECNILDGDHYICAGSSIMPQKKNYGPGTLIRTRSNHIYTYLCDALISAGSVTMFPEHCTFEFFNNFWQNVQYVTDNLKILQVALLHTRIRKDVAYKRALDGFTAATHMAEQLTMEIGEPFVKTHHIVGNMIHELMDKDELSIANMTPELMERASEKAVGFKVERTKEQIDEMLDPLESLKAKVTGGTPKPEDTEKLLKAAEDKRIENEAWLNDVKARLSGAYSKIEEGIR